MISTTKLKRATKWLMATIFVLIFLLLLFSVEYRQTYAARFLPGTSIAGIPVGGLTQDEAEALLTRAVSKYYVNGFIFKGGNKSVNINPVASSIDDPDLTYEIVDFDIEGSLARAWRLGRSGDVFGVLTDQARAKFGSISTQMKVDIDSDALVNALKENFSDRESPAQNAQVVYERGKWVVVPEQSGQVFDYDVGVRQLAGDLAVLKFQSIELPIINQEPEIFEEEAKEILPQVTEIGKQELITLKHDEQTWYVGQNDFRTWISLVKDNRETSIALDETKVGEFLEQIAKDFDRPAQDAKFEIKDGRVVEFQGSRDGMEIDIKKSMIVLEENTINQRVSESNLVVSTVKAEITTSDVNDLGIREIIGVGESDFVGSSQNRVKNIRNGANTLNGMLIEPGEEFSLVEALGDIDAENGYVQGYVIKGNKTIPEYGGGLCQIGTTTFRAALGSGLPITERRNHSYRVRYYEPAGTDATIYGPHPDFRFVNDTENNILIQTRIEGTKAIFEFWGTKDGRVAERTDPRIYNYISPPPKKIVETLDLTPGEEKCTEHAITGATAEFDYKVTYPDGEVKEEIFKSFYRPWQEVCLVGVEELSEEEEEEENQEA